MDRGGPRADVMADFFQATHTLTVPTRGKGFVEITASLRRWLESMRVEGGFLTVFVCHTSASLTIQENADPNVRVDLMAALEEFAPVHRRATATAFGLPTRSRRARLRAGWRGRRL
jgi:secondary thiamine-phosphate synthase enzyme